MASFFGPVSWQQGSKSLQSIPECGKCGLYKSCRSPKMSHTGRGVRSILFVGEAPGQTEDAQGVQLVGKSGQRLREALRKVAGIDLDDCYKTNAVCCRPQNNRIDDVYINCCRPNLLKTIHKLKPKVIVLLGGSAVKGLVPAERSADIGPIGRWVGWTIPSHEHQAWICPTYHPSYLLRMSDKVLDLIFEHHLKQAIRLEEKPVKTDPLENLKKRVERVTDPRSVRLRLKDLTWKEGVLAFDYESNRIKPDDKRCKIVACSFCLDGDDTFAIPVDDDLYPMISRVLRSPRLRKVASNLKNEERWTIAKMGHPVAGWWWDTMLAAHVLDNRQGISSLKFQAFVQFGIADYERDVHQFFGMYDKEGFNRIEECPLDNLLVYNGLDSLLEYRLAMVQRKQMGMTT